MTRPKHLVAAASFCAAAATVTTARTARADAEAWLWVENRVPLARTDRPELGRVDLRVFGDFRANRRSEGLGIVFGRMGPLFFLSDWMFVATTGSVAAIRGPNGQWSHQARAELEPNFFGRIGDFTFNDRNRGEYRVREDAENFFFYRNMLRISYAPVHARWIPYVFDEVLFNVTTREVSENRASVGLGRMVGGSTRIDLGYIFRSRKDPTFVHDHIVNLFFFFDVPPPPPVPGEAPPALPAPGIPNPPPPSPPPDEALPTPPHPAPGAPTTPTGPAPAPESHEDGG